MLSGIITHEFPAFQLDQLPDGYYVTWAARQEVKGKIEVMPFLPLGKTRGIYLFCNPATLLPRGCAALSAFGSCFDCHHRIKGR